MLVDLEVCTRVEKVVCWLLSSGLPGSPLESGRHPLTQESYFNLTIVLIVDPKFTRSSAVLPLFVFGDPSGENSECSFIFKLFYDKKLENTH